MQSSVTTTEEFVLTLSPTVPSRKSELAAIPRRRDPFRVEAPAELQFSGGRTSAYMLHRVLEAHGGGLPEDVHVVFANTGKEREETLHFVREVALRWNVPIRWVEYVSRQRPDPSFPADAVTFREVTFETASRNGEPFDACIRDRSALPNTWMRFCTTDLKIRTAWTFMWSQGYSHWDSLIGIRGDEPSRVAKIRSRPAEEWEDVELPLWDAEVDEREVLGFWAVQPFDLELAPGDGNCDLCMLKGAAIRLNVMRREPRRADWWLAKQAQVGAKWTKPGRATYEQLHHLAVHQQDLAGSECGLDNLGDCWCGD